MVPLSTTSYPNTVVPLSPTSYPNTMVPLPTTSDHNTMVPLPTTLDPNAMVFTNYEFGSSSRQQLNTLPPNSSLLASTMNTTSFTGIGAPRRNEQGSYERDVPDDRPPHISGSCIQIANKTCSVLGCVGSRILSAIDYISNCAADVLGITAPRYDIWFADAHQFQAQLLSEEKVPYVLELPHAYPPMDHLLKDPHAQMDQVVVDMQQFPPNSRNELE
ncbi:hypothetical protein BASA50_009094 [Batrachochytrium salamandrivorans]|uniref:Uncharacterized protein n=1 Tax=Batrachochytrium salamandrivorans TaxID=1357716 RepID=A0ABQ8F2V7_9FUNG|nr:hypothetical protein BASA50_009094 [Batrachochytrium salamandrivorans]